MAQTAKVDRLLARLPSLADIVRGSLLHRTTFHSGVLLQVCPRHRSSPVGPQCQLSRRQEPSDQLATRPVAPGPAVAQKLPPAEEGTGGHLRAEPALLAREILAARQQGP